MHSYLVPFNWFEYKCVFIKTHSANAFSLQGIGKFIVECDLSWTWFVLDIWRGPWRLSRPAPLQRLALAVERSKSHWNWFMSLKTRISTSVFEAHEHAAVCSCVCLCVYWGTHSKIQYNVYYTIFLNAGLPSPLYVSLSVTDRMLLCELRSFDWFDHEAKLLYYWSSTSVGHLDIFEFCFFECGEECVMSVVWNRGDTNQCLSARLKLCGCRVGEAGCVLCWVVFFCVGWPLRGQR